MTATRRAAGKGTARGAAAAAAVSLAVLAAGGPASAQEGAREGAQEPFRIGLVALPGEEAGVEGLGQIKAAYSGALGLPVEVMVARDYAALAEAQIGGRIDYAVYSAPAYAAASLRCRCLVPLAQPVDAGGAVGFRSVLVVRTDGPGGAGRLALGPADSLATRLAPLAASREAREAAAGGRLVEAQSAAHAQALFLRGEVDGFFGWVPATAEDGDGDDAAVSGTLAWLAASGLDPSAWRVAWRSAVLRYGPHAVRADMPAARMERLAGLLARAADDGVDLGARLAGGHGGGFAAVSAADYAPVEEALAALGGP